MPRPDEDAERPRAWKRKPRQPDVREPQASLFDFPLRQAAEARRDAEFVAPVMATPTRELRGMVRGTDAVESQRAACDVLGKLTAIQTQIVRILKAEGPQNARELEVRDEFRYLGVSTVRKRISELFHAGRIIQAGRRDGMAIWDVADTNVQRDSASR